MLQTKWSAKPYVSEKQRVWELLTAIRKVLIIIVICVMMINCLQQLGSSDSTEDKVENSFIGNLLYGKILIITFHVIIKMIIKAFIFYLG